MWPYNPYNIQPPVTPGFPQNTQQQVTRVNGHNGASAYALGPNSSALLLDESGTILWVVSTDGAGYKTIAPYDITPHVDQTEKNMASIEERLSRLEALINAPENTATTERTRAE